MFFAPLLLIFAAAQTDSTQADRDYTKVDRWGPLAFRVTEESRSSFNVALIDIRRQALLPLVWQFFQDHPADPRRWTLVLRLSNAKPFFASDYTQMARMYANGTPELTAIDTGAKRVWERRYTVLRSALMAAPEVSDTIRMEVRAFELIDELAQLKRTARCGESIDVRSVQDSLLAYAARYKPTGWFAAERLTHFLFDPVVRLSDLDAISDFLRKAQQSPDSELRQWSDHVAQLFMYPLILRGTTLQDTPVDLATYRNKVVFLDFWGTSCSSCVEAFPKLKQLYEQYHREGVEFIGVVIDSEDRRAQAKALVQRHGLPWLQLFTGASSEDVRKRFGIAGIPDGMIVRRGGMLVGRNYTQMRDIAAALDQLLGHSTRRAEQ